MRGSIRATIPLTPRPRHRMGNEPQKTKGTGYGGQFLKGSHFHGDSIEKIRISEGFVSVDTLQENGIGSDRV